MDENKRKAIELLVDTSITSFATGLTSRYKREVDLDDGVINMKRNNCFIKDDKTASVKIFFEQLITNTEKAIIGSRKESGSFLPATSF